MSHWLEERRKDDERHSERNRKSEDYDRVATELARVRLTEAELEAVIWAAHAAKYWAMYSENHAERELFAKRGEALRWLAEKHKCD